MLEFGQYLILVGVIILAAVIYVVAFGVVMSELHKLYLPIKRKRADRKILKTAERCRRDFA